MQNAHNPIPSNHKTKKGGVLYKNCNNNTKTHHLEVPELPQTQEQT